MARPSLPLARNPPTNPFPRRPPTLLQESAPFLRVLGSYPMDLELGVVDSAQPTGLFDGTGQA